MQSMQEGMRTNTSCAGIEITFATITAYLCHSLLFRCFNFVIFQDKRSGNWSARRPSNRKARHDRKGKARRGRCIQDCSLVFSSRLLTIHRHLPLSTLHVTYFNHVLRYLFFPALSIGRLGVCGQRLLPQRQRSQLRLG